MNSCGASLLLADNPVVHMGERFRSSGAGVEVSHLLWVATLLLSALLAVWFFSRLALLRRRRNNPQALFLELCQAHQLDRQSRKLLNRLARHHQLEHPALLFLDPERFDPAQLGRAWGECAGELVALRDRLFSRPVN